MTRDEAIKIAEKAWFEQFPSNNVPTSLISVLESLGMLKLDEPKNATRKFIDMFNDLEPEHRMSGNVLVALDVAGLKIVEK